MLLTTNTNAGTIPRQIAFDKSVRRHLGSDVDRLSALPEGYTHVSVI